MIHKAKLVGWAMTGGQDAAAAVCRLLLAAAVLDGAAAMLTARRPEPRLLDVCRRRHITLVRITDDAAVEPTEGWVDARLAPGRTTGLHALVADPSLTVLVRPDRYIAAVGTRSQPPHPSWTMH